MLSGYNTVRTFNYEEFRWRKKMTIPMAVFDVAVLWYYSFGGSLTLRPMVSFFWIFMAVVGIFVFDMNVFPLSRYLLLGLVSVAYMLITALFSVDQNASLKYAFSMLLYLLIAIEITSNYENIRFFIKVLFVYSVVLLTIGYIQKFVPDTFQSIFLPLLPSEYRGNILNFMERGSVSGFFNQTSSNALAMSLGTGVCVFRLIKTPQNKVFARAVNFLLLMAFIYGLILTARRGASLIVAMLLTYIVYSYRKNYLTKLLVTVCAVWILIFGGISYIPELATILDKNTQYVMSGDISNGRFEIWAKCLELFVQNPLFGIGADSISVFLDSSSAHNSFIQILVELGLLGFVFYFMPFVYGLIIAMKQNKSMRPFTKEEKAIMVFALFWQLFCFGNSIFEATFSSEITVFMLFISQLIVIKLAQQKRNYGNRN